ncbi:hypothetical protein [Methylobacterium mesophilicum]
MTPMLFRNMLPLRPRKQFTALEDLAAALGEMATTCSALEVHARTKAQRAEWQNVSLRVRVAHRNAADGIEAIMSGTDVWDLVDAGWYVHLPYTFRLVGEVEALGRLYIRTVGTAAYTDVKERVADVYKCLVRLAELHVENHPAMPPPASARRGVFRAV